MINPGSCLTITNGIKLPAKITILAKLASPLDLGPFLLKKAISDAMKYANDKKTKINIEYPIK